MRLCEVDGCSNTYYAKGYCKSHYYRVKRIGTTDAMRVRGVRKHDAPEYRAWCGIKTRCTNSNELCWENYGGRGIKVCDEWVHNYSAFLKHVGNRPSNRHSIDRIDNNRGYEPGNVRWATRVEQASNRRNNNTIVGVSYDNLYKRWNARLTIGRVRVLNKMFDTYDDAVQCRKNKEVEMGLK